MSEPVQVHPQLAQLLLDGEKQKEMHKIVWLAKVHPDDNDLAVVIVVQCTTFLFTVDAAEAYSLFLNNLPEHYNNVLYVLSVAPHGGVVEDQMLEITRGPRPVN